jgi:hypothetical protein
MNKLAVIVGTLVAVSLAFVTADMESPPQRRIRRGALHAGANPAVAPTPADPASAGEPGDAAGSDAPKKDPEKDPEKDPGKKPDPDQAEYVSHEVKDFDLCIADNGKPPSVGRVVELHIGMEGEVFWYASSGSVEMGSDKDLSKRLTQRMGHHLVLVPHQETVWMRFREIAEVTTQGGFGPRTWLGVASSDEPRMLQFLPFLLDHDRDPELIEGRPYFRVYVKEGQGGEPEYTVGGQRIESFPADLAIAWNEWSKDHPQMAKDTSDPDTSPVVLDAHRFTPMKLIVPVIDVFRGLGIESERMGGGVPKRRR